MDEANVIIVHVVPSMLLPITVNLSDLIGNRSVLEGLKVDSRDRLLDVFYNLLERCQGLS